MFGGIGGERKKVFSCMCQLYNLLGVGQHFINNNIYIYVLYEYTYILLFFVMYCFYLLIYVRYMHTLQATITYPKHHYIQNLS